MASVETLGALERRLNAFIPQQLIRGEIESRLKRLGRTAKVHGFRPGKVPLNILRQQYGAQVRQEVLGDALQRSFAEAAQANSLKVAGYPNFEITGSDPSAEQIEFSATFEIFPEVVLGDLSAESVERVTYTLTDADIDNTIATLRKQRAVFEEVGRAAQNEDQVHIDFQGKLDGVVFEGGEAKDLPLVLGTGRMLPDFEAAIIGMKAGETKSFDMTFPVEYHGKDVAGKQVTFSVSLHKVEMPNLPELNAEFAKALGIQNGDLNKLKADIRDNLGREIERRIKARNKDNAMNVLLKVAQLDVPKVLLNQEIQSLMDHAMQDLQGRGVKIPSGMSLPVDMFAERANQRVKMGLIMTELVRQHDLKASPEQIKALVQEYAQSFEHPEEVVKWHYSNPSRLQEVEAMALEENTVAWVMKTAKAIDKVVDFNELMGNN